MTEAADSHVQLVVLRLEGREYAVPVEQTTEVLRVVAVTPLPEAPAWVAGTINLRGRALPVLDLRARLGLPQVPPDLSAAIVVVETAGRPVGLLADTVVEVMRLPPAALVPPDATAGAAHPFAAIARADERLILVFDLERLCGPASPGAGESVRAPAEALAP